MKKYKRFYGWNMLGIMMCIIVMTMGFPLFGPGVINAVMAKEMALPRGVMGLGFTVAVIAGGLPGPLVAHVIWKIGARRTIVIGALIMALGSLLMATVVSNGWQYVVVFGIVIGTGMCFGAAIPAQTVIMHWFHRKRAFALSVFWLAVGAGGAIAAPLIGYMIASAAGNWRVGWYLLMSMTLVAALVSYLFVKDSPAEIGQLPDGNQVGASAEEAAKTAATKPDKTHRVAENWTARAALRTPQFWIITAAASAYMLQIMVMFAHLITHLKDLGHLPAMGALALGVVGGSQVVGKLVAGAIGDHIEPRFIWSIGLAMIAGGFMMSIESRSRSEIYEFAFLIGSGQGVSLVCMPTMLANYFGHRAFHTLIGAQSFVTTLVVAGGPVLVGLSFDRFGTYAPAFTIVSGVALIGAFLILFNRPPKLGEPGTSAWIQRET